MIPAVQKLFPQYRNSSRSTEIISAVQKLIPQYRNSAQSTEIIHAVQISTGLINSTPLPGNFFISAGSVPRSAPGCDPRSKPSWQPHFGIWRLKAHTPNHPEIFWRYSAPLLGPGAYLLSLARQTRSRHIKRRCASFWKSE